MSHIVLTPDRRRSRRTGLLAAAAAAAAATLFALAPVTALAGGGGARERLASFVPSDAYVFAAFEGFAACDEAARTLDLHNLWAEPETQAFVGDAINMLRGHLSQLESGDGVPVGELRSMLSGPIAFAAGDLTLVDPPGMGRGGPPIVPMPGMLLALEAGQNRQKIADHVERLLGMAGGEVVRGSFDYKGRRIEKISPPGSRFLSICWTWVDDVLLVGLNKYFLERAIDCHEASGRGSLAQDAGFRRACGKVAGADVVQLYVNVNGFRSKLGPLMPPEFLDLAGLFGVSSVNGLYVALKTEGSIGKEVIYLDAPGEKTGLLKILAPGASPMKALEYAPRDTAYFLSLKIDPVGAFREAEKLAGAVEPGAVGEIRQGLARANQELGFDILGDFAASLGGEISLFAWTPAGGAPLPSFALLVGLEDRRKFESCLETILAKAGSGLEKKSLPFEGTEIRYFQIPGVPVVPSYMATDDGLLVASAPNIVKELVQRRKRGDETLARNPEFVAARKAMVGGASLFEYLDVRPFVGMVYGMASMALPGLSQQMQGIPIDFALLPTTDTITRHLSPTLGGYVADKDGLLLESRGPLATGALLALVATATRALEKVRIGPETIRQMRSERRTEVVAAPVPVRPSPNDGGGGGGGGGGGDPLQAFAEAQRHFQSGNYAQAIERYDVALRHDPENGTAAFNRAFALHGIGRHTEAIEGFRQAVELGQSPSICEYNIACGYAKMAQLDPAFEHLEKALKLGFERTSLLESDSDLDNLRTDPRFEKIKKSRSQ